MLYTLIGLRRAASAAPDGIPFRVKTKTISDWTGLSDKTTRLALSVIRDSGRFFFRRAAGGYEYLLPAAVAGERITWFPNLPASALPLSAVAALYAGLSWADYGGRINPAFYREARRRGMPYTGLLAERGRCGTDAVKDGLRFLREAGLAAGDFRGRTILRFFPQAAAERRDSPAAAEGGLFPPEEAEPADYPEAAAEERRRAEAVRREAAAEAAWRREEEAEERRRKRAAAEGTGKIPATYHACAQAISLDPEMKAGFAKKPCRSPSMGAPVPKSGGGRRRKDAWISRLDKVSATGGRKPGPVSAAGKKNGDNRKPGSGGGGSPADAAIAAFTGIDPAADATFRLALAVSRYRASNPDYPPITSPVRYAIRLYSCYRTEGKACGYPANHPGPCGTAAAEEDRAEIAAWRKGFPSWKSRRLADKRRAVRRREAAERRRADEAGEEAVEAIRPGPAFRRKTKEEAAEGIGGRSRRLPGIRRNQAAAGYRRDNLETKLRINEMRRRKKRNQTAAETGFQAALPFPPAPTRRRKKKPVSEDGGLPPPERKRKKRRPIRPPSPRPAAETGFFRRRIDDIPAAEKWASRNRRPPRR